MSSTDAVPEETERLKALAAYRILDTAPEPPFDDLVQLAARCMEMPIAVLTLVDARRQWFKAKTGLEITETPREIAFCDYTIRSKELFVVPDMHADQRFHDNPLVLGKPNLRFYAGAPLKTPDGKVLGTLAVMDNVTRALAPQQAATLRALARQAESQLELRLLMRRLAERSSALAQANADLQTFGDAVASDLRAPLRAVSGALARLSGALGEEAQRRDAAEARERAQELEAMLEALHAFARDARPGGAFKAVDMRALAERSVEILEKTYAGAGARMLIEPMPQALGSEPLLLNVWTSVISNALKFATAGASLLEIGAVREAEAVRYFVRDRTRPDGASPNPGLGLGVARRIVERHGGTLEAASEPGQGTVVFFVLPSA